MNGKLMTEFLALNPKVYSYKYLGFIEDTFDEKLIDGNEHELTEINKKKLKGVSKVVAKNDIKHEDYINVFNTYKPKKCNVVSIRSFNHELFTVLQNKTALTSYYDKMKMVNGNECVPFGYMED